MKRYGPIEHHDRDLDDAIAAERADAGGLDVDDGKSTCVERWALSRRLRGQRPAAVGGASEPRIRGEQRQGDAVGGVAAFLPDAPHVADRSQPRPPAPP